jgi:2-oxoglutarate ferredoxin oxidoreductase subunit gamma
MKTVKILLSGEGGQGIQTIAKAIFDSAIKAGLNASYIPSFGVEQRGTPSVAFVIISKEDINYPRFDVADYAVILQKRAISIVSRYISPNTKVIFDSSTIAPSDLPKTSTSIYATPATKYAFEKFTPRAFNILMIGKLSKLLELDETKTWESVEKTLLKKLKDEKIKKLNKDAFLFGRDIVFEVDEFTKPSFVSSREKIIAKGFNKQAMILPERCKGCGICIEKCPVKALHFSKTLGVYASPVPEIDLEKCITCGNCLRFCPDGAIGVEKVNNPDKK